MGNRIKRDIKLIKLFLISLIVVSLNIKAVSFDEAVKSLQTHESVEAAQLKAKAIGEEAELQGSWGDPHFNIAAMSFPRDTLDKNQTAMTGIKFGISQKIALTSKYGNVEKAFQSLSAAYLFDANDRREALTKGLWEILIIKRKVKDELLILNENSIWISKILKVSKRLYSTGKISQQALLDIQIRKSEIESEISNKNYEISQINDRLKYLIGSSVIDESTIPWQSLSSHQKDSDKSKNNKERSLEEKLRAKELNLTASRLNYIPDITVSFGYTKRSNLDGHGDFVGAAISFPLPFSGEKYSKNEKAVQEKYMAIKDYKNYKREKERDVSLLNKEISKLLEELDILKKRTIKFARNSRKITSKSYGLGRSTYVELLQSELKLQKILMHKVKLEAKRDIKRAALKYVKGEALNE